MGNTTAKLPKDFAAVNAMEQIPTLEITDSNDGSVVQLSQSMAILEYLDELAPQASILPGDKLIRARAREVSC